ncbi:hypothetical protein FRX31_033817 [Thalictrum thalictroides]|uniref:Uncharacterized protein n=1 Tax=Thalictrum thalictroides TaxID=46969 RepID=A0A7J6UVJ1_THATH|nr:hypothetical protein FRX31_033817 [Thalictrum thalictroides]
MFKARAPEWLGEFYNSRTVLGTLHASSGQWDKLIPEAQTLNQMQEFSVISKLRNYAGETESTISNEKTPVLGEVRDSSPMPKNRSWKDVVSGQFSKFEIQGGDSTKKQGQPTVVAGKVAKLQQKSGVATGPTLLTQEVKRKVVVVDETP